MLPNLSIEAFSELVGYLYEGPMETPPWQSFTRQFQQHLECNYVTIILRPPSDQMSGLMVNSSALDEVVASYNNYYFALDPFVGLPNMQVVSVDEIVPKDEFIKSEFFKAFISPFDIAHLMGVDINTSDGAQCRVRVSRNSKSPDFSDADKRFLALFVPHFERAIRLHTHVNRLESERNLYAGTVDQLAVGTIILDQDGRLMQRNRSAERLLHEKDGIKLLNDELVVGNARESREFKRLVKQALGCHKQTTPSVAEALRIQRPSGRSDLGILVRSIPLSDWNEGKQCPSVAIFINDPEDTSSAPQEVVKALFDLTPAETQLAMHLANGLTLDEVSEELGISRNTARAHLRSIFSKTGVTRQTMLVRLILRSVANLG